jgi:single-strand DNA-binding protein
VNKLILIGRLGQDPELRTTQTGKTVCNFTLATSEKYDGKETTEWHKIIAWGKPGEIIYQHSRKGDQLALSGKVTYRSYDGKNGKVFMTEVILQEFHFIGGKSERSEPRQEPQQEPDNSINDDDIPF